jgi:hypothetical protein
MASNADEKNGGVLLSPARRKRDFGAAVKKAATVCELELVGERQVKNRAQTWILIIQRS